MSTSTPMLDRLITHWPYGGFLAGLLLLLLAPLLTAGWAPVLVATFLHLPAYMIHQYEEHDDDRFRRFFNQTLGGGREVLSPLAVFVTNVPGVWLVIAGSLAAAVAVSHGWALIAVYLVLVNAFVHIAHAVAFRRYNPGLASGILVFLPLGAYAQWLLARAGSATAWHHAVGLGVAVVLHVAILGHVFRRRAALATGSTAGSRQGS